LDLINEIHPNLAGTGKSVDMNDPILPNSMPRDYGGVAILWKKSIDQYIRPTSDGSERIQERANVVVVVVVVLDVPPLIKAHPHTILGITIK
jgi:hypothetical protein